MKPNETHLLFINQHYSPDNAATALVLNDLAEKAVREGFHVSVICSQFLYDFSGQMLPKYEVLNGVHVYRVKQTNFGRFSTRGRLKDYGSFFFNALIKSLQLKPDILVTLTTPPLLGAIGFIHKLFRPLKFVYWCMDLHPEAEIATGLIRPHSFIHHFFSSLHSKILASADAVVSLSEHMRLKLRSYPIEFKNLTKISIWSDEQELTQTIIPNSGRKKLPKWIQHRFIIHYSGNLGLAHHWMPFFQVMKSLSQFKHIGFLFTGGGPQMPYLQDFCIKNQLENVHFRPYVDRNELNESLQIGDLNWLSLKPEFEGIAYPSKLIGYMAAAKPILFVGNSDSDSAQLIHAAQCGVVFSELEPQYLQRFILEITNKKEKLTQWGMNGRNFFEKNLTKEKLCSEWASLLHELAS